jgi:hypothetical protein
LLHKESFDKIFRPKNSEVEEGDDVFLRMEVTEVGRNHKLESLVQGPYRVLENAGATSGCASARRTYAFRLIA